jgi:hypothetical protein
MPLFGSAECDKSEAAGTAGGAIHHDDGISDGSVLAKDLAKVGVTC